MSPPETALNVQTISSPAMTLEVLPDLGASLLNLRAASGRPVLRAVNPQGVQSSSQCASFTLLPFSNRVRDARFVFGGREVQLRVTTKDGLTQHGDVRNRPWQVSRPSDTALVCEFDSRHFADVNWPWAFTATVEYRLHGPHLDTSVTLTNVDTTPMPAGLGLHPYFTRLHEGVDPALELPAALIYDTDDRALPQAEARPVRPDEDFRRPAPLGHRQPDQVYTAWDGIARLDWGQRALTITADNVYSHVVLFAAPDGSLALEPVSHATDALNLANQGVAGADLRVLAPGQSLAGAVRFTLEGNW
ncbi:aldose 1-epimerase [Deinococcus deserti]|uniref:Putative aldose 1-epimerase (Aldose mutarotase) n=1 Tax=Deinococcus deserti (strain DSM 17065 / CIP 109153 / LMG 22923 / VCD115) TaxID=546414 RepID=C1D0E5_DEIDV|nr:putative aldose 1-epimerase (aldose mutarotase) [Deinococcus deserti VCD115]